MRPRLLGLAVLAVLAVAAFVGAGSASAVTLCGVNESPCAAENAYPGGATLEGAAGAASNSALVSAAMEVKCDEATVEVETLAESESPLPAKISFPTFATCARAGFGSCTQEATSAAYAAKISASGGGNGTLVTGGAVVLKYQCGEIACRYGAEIEPSITGSSSYPTLGIGEWEMTKQAGSSEECSQTASWTVKYTSISPLSLFVAASP